MKHFVEAWKGLGDSEDDLGVSKVSRSIWGILVVSARKSVTIPKPFAISQQRTQLYNRFSRVPSILTDSIQSIMWRRSRWWWDGGASALSKPPEPLRLKTIWGKVCCLGIITMRCMLLIHRADRYEFFVLQGISHSALLSGTTSCYLRITQCPARVFAIRTMFALSCRSPLCPCDLPIVYFELNPVFEVARKSVLATPALYDRLAIRRHGPHEPRRHVSFRINAQLNGVKPWIKKCQFQTKSDNAKRGEEK